MANKSNFFSLNISSRTVVDGVDATDSFGESFDIFRFRPGVKYFVSISSSSVHTESVFYLYVVCIWQAATRHKIFMWSEDDEDILNFFESIKDVKTRLLRIMCVVMSTGVSVMYSFSGFIVP